MYMNPLEELAKIASVLELDGHKELAAQVDKVASQLEKTAADSPEFHLFQKYIKAVGEARQKLVSESGGKDILLKVGAKFGNNKEAKQAYDEAGRLVQDLDKFIDTLRKLHSGI